MTRATDFDRYPLREVPLPATTSARLERFLRTLDDKLASGANRVDVCREAARELITGKGDLAGSGSSSDPEPWSDNLLLASLDSRNVTLEAERYGDADPVRYAERKPLIWLWYLFDRSSWGMSLDLGFRLRQVLGKYIFKSFGHNVKIFPYLEIAFGYSLDIGDDVVIHRWVNLDDRAGISIGHRSSLSDYVNVYSHTHDINEQALVANRAVVIEDDVRVTYHATILAGTHLERGCMVGAHALVTGKRVPAGEVWVGVPAKRVVDKDYFIDPPSCERWTVNELRQRRNAP